MDFNRENLEKVLAGENPTPEQQKLASNMAQGIENSIKIAAFAEDNLGKDVDELARKAQRLTGIEAVNSEKVAASIGSEEDKDYQKIAAAFGDDVAKSIASDVIKVSRLLEVTASTPQDVYSSMQLTAAEAVEKRAALAQAGYMKNEIERFMQDWI